MYHQAAMQKQTPQCITEQRYQKIAENVSPIGDTRNTPKTHHQGAIKEIPSNVPPVETHKMPKNVSLVCISRRILTHPDLPTLTDTSLTPHWHLPTLTDTSPTLTDTYRHFTDTYRQYPSWSALTDTYRHSPGTPPADENPTWQKNSSRNPPKA